MKNNRIRVLMLSPWYPHKYDAMPGLFVKRHAQAISTYCDVDVLYIHSDENQVENGLNFEKEVNGSLSENRVYYKKIKSAFPVISSILKLYWYYKAYKYGLKKILENHAEFNIIHTNILTRTAVVALLFSLKLKIPFVITEHWSRYLPIRNEFHGFFRKLITRYMVKKAKAVLPVTENLKRAMLAHQLENPNYIVIPNVVDVNLFCRKEKNNTNKKQIVHVSCFEDKSKNISGILRTAKKLYAKRQDFEIHLVGDGPDMATLQNYATALELKDKVVFFDGLKEGEALVMSIACSDFMLLFSNFENMPVVINEALACGIPLLSSRVGGIPEVITAENGILVDPKNELELYEKTDFMLDNFFTYNPEKLRQYAVEHFSMEAVAKKITTIYMQIVAK